MLLSIEHKTLYRYSQPVELGPHRLMMRPLEGHDVQIRSSGLSISPAYRIRWLRDVFDNSVAIVELLEPTRELAIVSTVQIEQFNTNPFDFMLDPRAYSIPFKYAEEESFDVGPYLHLIFPNDRDQVAQWLQPFMNFDGPVNTLDFLLAINKSFPHYFQYAQREEPGVQSPAETLNRRSGSCRDFALLLMEGVRQLGLAARFVSGYLCHAGSTVPDPARNATHAWAEIYLPGAGWKGFDPTCGILAADLHVRTAVTRHPAQAPPVSGTFKGINRDYQGMTVTVNARVVSN